MNKSKNIFLNIILDFLSRYLSNQVLSSRALGYIFFNAFAILIFILIIFQFTAIDLSVQKLLYKGDGLWLIDRQDESLKLLFYVIPKKIVTVFLSIILVFVIYIKVFHPYNPEIQRINMMLIYAIIASISIVLLVGVLKQTTNMYCPDAIREFGGMGEFFKLFDLDITNKQFYKQGKCFPAGHATTGYCLIPITFILRKKRHQINWFLFSFLMGSVLGFYQMAKGVHYLSDTIVTFIFALICSIICYRFLMKKI